MKSALEYVKGHLLATVALAALLFAPMLVFAQAAPPDPTADFVTLFLKDLNEFGGMSAVAKVSAVVMLLIASMKVNLINENLWNKLGDGWKTLVGPILAAVAGLVTLSMNGQLDLPHLMVWVTAGAGAVVLHEGLDRVKLIPGIGPTYVALINLVEGFLDQKKTDQPTS
jgi:ABC-type uncharacterized transport system permease subunit